jgi:protein involved in polysaccharide export with SLBB domain
MSADQIIGILREQPDILASVKNAVARQAGIDPSAISDDAIYGRIQQDPNLRAQLTQDLNKRGFSTNVTAETKASAAGTTTSSETSRPSTARMNPDTDQDQPQTIQRPNPYQELPSLHDLYTQIPPAGGRLQRFGSNAFILGTGNANELPMDLPVGPDYVLGPGDNIVVNMWGGHSERLSLTIDRQGQIALPEAGTVTLDRLTIAQAQAAIEKALGTQFQNERVELSLGRLRTVRVYVVGDVQKPGGYDVSSLSTPLSALYAAGGPTSRGSLRVLRQYRGTELVRSIDLYDFLLRGVRSTTDRLLPGDTIMVPPVGRQVTVEGMVHRPAIYELNGEQDLNQVLELAGGVLISASLNQINIERIEAHQRRTMVSLELPDTEQEIKQKLDGFKVQAGDDVVISQILPYNQQAVYLEGHVFRPGKYPYRDGMTIADLLHSYQDIMPEPSDHVELIRLQAPDYRPETISLNLRDVLIGNSPLPLQPFDLIRVFSRYEIDVPSVSIEGEVLRPGDYPMSQGMTVAALVQMAGGFKRSAFRDEADLSSYTVQDGKKVLLEHSVVEIKAVLDGASKSDVLLKPGDVVSVRQLAGWQDIGSSVSIEGEVEHAGSYGIEPGERLSSVLKRAGGFRDSAFPAAAVLERVQVRALAEQARQEMIQRLESTPVDVRVGVLPSQDQTNLQQSLQQQRLQVLTALRNHPASGRMVINISSDIGKWENTSADIELRAGDTLTIPKRPSFVMVSGQVYNATAISYVPGRTVGWYLGKAGGATPYGSKKDIYVLRSNGAIIAHGNNWISGDFMGLRLQPGDSIIVPEKLIGGSQVWRDLIATAQIMSAAALPIAISGAF